MSKYYIVSREEAIKYIVGIVLICVGLMLLIGMAARADAATLTSANPMPCNATITWTPSAGQQAYILYVGTTQGAGNIYQSGCTNGSQPSFGGGVLCNYQGQNVWVRMSEWVTGGCNNTRTNTDVSLPIVSPAGVVTTPTTVTSPSSLGFCVVAPIKNYKAWYWGCYTRQDVYNLVKNVITYEGGANFFAMGDKDQWYSPNSAYAFTTDGNGKIYIDIYANMFHKDGDFDTNFTDQDLEFYSPNTQQFINLMHQQDSGQMQNTPNCYSSCSSACASNYVSGAAQCTGNNPNVTCTCIDMSQANGGYPCNDSGTPVCFYVLGGTYTWFTGSVSGLPGGFTNLGVNTGTCRGNISAWTNDKCLANCAQSCANKNANDTDKLSADSANNPTGVGQALGKDMGGGVGSGNSRPGANGSPTGGQGGSGTGGGAAGDASNNGSSGNGQTTTVDLTPVTNAVNTLHGDLTTDGGAYPQPNQVPEFAPATDSDKPEKTDWVSTIQGYVTNHPLVALIKGSGITASAGDACSGYAGTALGNIAIGFEDPVSQNTFDKMGNLLVAASGIFSLFIMFGKG